MGDGCSRRRAKAVISAVQVAKDSPLATHQAQHPNISYRIPQVLSFTKMGGGYSDLGVAMSLGSELCLYLSIVLIRTLRVTDRPCDVGDNVILVIFFDGLYC